jgi:hypothetical protein
MNIKKKTLSGQINIFCFSVIHGFLKWNDKEDIYDYDYLSSKNVPAQFHVDCLIAWRERASS